MPNLNEIYTKLNQPVDPRPLVYFRLIFTLILLFETFRWGGYVFEYYVNRKFHFTYPFFEFVKPLSESGMYVILGLMGLCIIGMLLGLFYRLFSIGFFLLYAYLFFLDHSYFNNHYYFIMILAFILIFINPHAYFSLDYLRKKIPEVGVPLWHLLILKIMVTIVYFYAGLAKITPDWLQGQPFRIAAQGKDTGLELLNQLIQSDFGGYFFPYAGLFLDLFVGFMLWFRLTRPLAIVMLLIFHGTNHLMFTIDIFPWLMFGLSFIFIEPQTFQKIIALKDGLKIELPPTKPLWQKLSFYTIAVLLGVQILLPFRHYFIPGNVSWTEEGRLFAWQMKMRSKSGDIKFLLEVEGAKRKQLVEVYKVLDINQLRDLAARPFAILQMARHIADKAESKGAKVKGVYALTLVKMNHHKPQPLVDKNVNLLEVDYKIFQHNDWILQHKPGGALSDSETEEEGSGMKTPDTISEPD